MELQSYGHIKEASNGKELFLEPTAYKVFQFICSP